MPADVPDALARRFPPDTATYDPAHLPPTTEQDQYGALHFLLGPERSFEAVRQVPTSAVLAATKLHSAKMCMSTLCKISAFGGMTILVRVVSNKR